MSVLKKIISITIISIVILHNVQINVFASPNATTETPVNIAVFLNNFNDLFISNLKKSLEDIQKKNEDKVQFTFFDSKGNQVSQNENISNALNSGKFNLFVINLVSMKTEEFESIFNAITQKNIPVIIYSPPNTSLADFVRHYPRTVIIGGNDEQSGTLEGKVLVDAWNANKQTIDRNKDNIMQYVMLQGPLSHPTTIARSKYSIEAINDAGIKTEQLLSATCYWQKECAKTTIESALLNLGNKIEVIIANNDEMAIGAIEALQKYGFNKGDKSKYIPVVGVDAVPEAKELIKQGVMTGTVIQDTREFANAIYSIGLNMASGNNPLAGTNYKFDETGITVRLPYHEYIE
jgi:methyl-galactoside transport system substrate-binding protein